MKQLSSLNEGGDECDAFGEEIARAARKLPEGYERELFFREVRDVLFKRRLGTETPTPTPAATTTLLTDVISVDYEMI